TPFTLSTLYVMQQRKDRKEWRSTAFLAALIYNVNCTDKDKQKTADDFDIYATKKRKRSSGMSIKDWVKAKLPQGG
ncbi:MAG TPA: hypothetical protein VFE62_07525, partial [Gemmataceae bacterium]|nr:hypothetical protein [Gemmataceae bacterium]